MRIDSPMGGNIAFNGECFITYITCVRPFTYLWYSFVNGQFGANNKKKMFFIWELVVMKDRGHFQSRSDLNTCMNPFMYIESGSLRKSFRANFTSEWPFSCMCSLMDIQIWFTAECCRTQIAAKRSCCYYFRRKIIHLINRSIKLCYRVHWPN